MKTLIAISLILSATVFSAPEYSPKIGQAVALLETATTEVHWSNDGSILKSEMRSFVGGCSVGYLGDPGAFFLLMPFFEAFATEEDVILMLRAKNPVVRVMAARVILSGPQERKTKFTLATLLSDKQMLVVARGGCIVDEMAVGDLVSGMRDDPDYFGEIFYYQSKLEGKKSANKRPEGTSGEAPPSNPSPGAAVPHP